MENDVLVFTHTDLKFNYRYALIKRTHLNKTGLYT